MKTGTEDKKKLIMLGVAGAVLLVALYYAYSELYGGGPAPAPTVASAPASSPAAVVNPTKPVVISRPSGTVVGKAAKNVGTASTVLDPTLKMHAMLVTESLVYSGSGRNIFSSTSVPAAVNIPKPIASARPRGPVMPVVRGPTGPPPLPPIDLKFFGTATSANGHRQAFLLRGEDVFLASDGDIVQRRYRVVSVAANSIVVEDLVNNNRQTLPLMAN
jgi:hypothetical protein